MPPLLKHQMQQINKMGSIQDVEECPSQLTLQKSVSFDKYHCTMGHGDNRRSAPTTDHFNNNNVATGPSHLIPGGPSGASGLPGPSRRPRMGQSSLHQSAVLPVSRTDENCNSRTSRDLNTKRLACSQDVTRPVALYDNSNIPARKSALQLKLPSPPVTKTEVRISLNVNTKIKLHLLAVGHRILLAFKLCKLLFI